jgi:hypothetical protein
VIAERCVVRSPEGKSASVSEIRGMRFVLMRPAAFGVAIALMISMGAAGGTASRGHTPAEGPKYRLGTGVDATESGADALAPPIANDGAGAMTNEWSTIFSDDFESGFPGSAWDVWRSNRSAEAVWDIWRCWYGDSADKSAGCAAGGAEGIGCDGRYPNNMDSWIVYGPFSLAQPGITAAELSFNFKVESEENSDYFYAAVSTDGDQFSWVRWSGTVAPGSYTMDLSDAPGEGNLLGYEQVWIGFLFQSDWSEAPGVGAQVDDVVIRASYPPPGAPELEISALKNPGQVRSLLIFVTVSDGSGNPPTVRVGDTDIQVSAIGNSVYLGRYFASSGESSVTVTATDTNATGTGSGQTTVEF